MSKSQRFVGYLFDERGYHGAGVPLFGAQMAYEFCATHWRIWHEVRIVDWPREEATVLCAKGGELICPMPDGELKRLPMEKIERLVFEGALEGLR